MAAKEEAKGGWNAARARCSMETHANGADVWLVNVIGARRVNIYKGREVILTRFELKTDGFETGANRNRVNRRLV